MASSGQQASFSICPVFGESRLIVRTASWESKLVSLALEGLRDSNDPQQRVLAVKSPEDGRLAQAYSECEQITRLNSRTFYLASGLLPDGKRQAARVLYAFCRVTDDLVDKRKGNSIERLNRWANSTLSDQPDRKNPIALAWYEIRARFQVPTRYAEQLIAGVAMDIDHARYETFDDLVAYCYGVASTVGLMAMHIIGYEGHEAVKYAVRLGVALQLTNILRDVGEDWRNGRLYLPLNELRAYNLDEGDIARGIVDDRWRALMRFQIKRTRQIFESARPGIRMLHKDGRFAIAAAAYLYRGILDDIERHDYDVFHRRAYVSAWGKVRRLPWIWIKSL
jgi:15-cis-phytoene synthase